MFLFSQTTPESWNTVININYKGVLNCVYAVREEGRVISISSDAAKVESIGESVYSGANPSLSF